jgi:diguanylate cyclase (GGDEF)-like protein
MQISKTQFKKDIRSSVVGQDWELLLPAFADAHDLNDLNKTRNVLQEAQQIIRAQEKRIHLLEKMALTDELTGLSNRRGFSAAFNRELSLAQRDVKSGGVLVMIDLDGFKEINDKWGHQVGDAYLRVVAQTLQGGIRTSDVVARLGGDEFGVLMPHMDEEAGVKRLEKLAHLFNESEMQPYGRMTQSLVLRASFGLAPYVGGDNADDVMQLADIRLYAHKARNKQPIVAG